MAGGIFVIGEYVGVAPGDYPFLLVRTGEPIGDKPGYVERISFTPFHPISGERTIPSSINEGDRIAVRVQLDARFFVRDGKTQQFVTKTARFVGLADELG